MLYKKRDFVLFSFDIFHDDAVWSAWFVGWVVSVGSSSAIESQSNMKHEKLNIWGYRSMIHEIYITVMDMDYTKGPIAFIRFYSCWGRIIAVKNF